MGQVKATPRRRDIEDELRVAREALLKLENHHREQMQRSLADLRNIVAELELARITERAANVQP